MKLTMYDPVSPEFQPLPLAEFHCPHCSRQVRMPLDMLTRTAADAMNDYYQQRCNRLLAENARLTEMIEMAGLIHTIKRAAKHI